MYRRRTGWQPEVYREGTLYLESVHLELSLSALYRRVKFDTRNKKMSTICLILLLVMGALALEAKDLVNAVIFLGVFSLISALLFFYFHAPDVALTEAAVGAGVSTVIFIWVIRKTERQDRS